MNKLYINVIEKNKNKKIKNKNINVTEKKE